MPDHRKLANEELDRLSPEEFQQSDKIPLVIVLDNIRSHNNVGSVFRTSDAFLVEAIYLCGFTGTPPHRDIHKTALGATDTVAWKHFEETTEAVLELQKNGYKVMAIEQAENSVPLDKFAVSEGEKLAVVMGNEVMGVDQEVLDMVDGVIELTQYGTKHSLNISVCTGIVVWELRKKLTVGAI